MKRTFLPNRKPLLTLVSIGVALGALVTLLCWIFPSSMASLLTSVLWPQAILLVGGLLILIALKLAEKRGYLDIPKPVLLLAVAAATALVYLFPELFAPGCNGMPKAFAACPPSCQITTCSHWVAAGDTLPNGNICSPSNPWDLGCCISYTTTCDPDCDTGGGGGGSDDPPTITGTVACTLDGNGVWCRGGATLNLSASDPQGYATTISGDIDGAPFSCAGPSCTRALPIGNGPIHFKATAATSGLASATGSTTFAYDPTPPTATLSISGTTGSAGWYTSSAHVSTIGTDTTSGISVTQVAVDGGAWQTSANLVEGTHSVMGRAIDNAGNVTVTSSQTVKVDVTAPTISAAVTSGTQVAGWYVTSVTVTASASDATSGLALVENLLAGGVWAAGNTVTLASDGIHTVDFRATDRAGLPSTTSRTVKVDQTDPVITLSPSGTLGSNNWYTSSVTLSLSAQDAISGVVSLEYSLNGGSWVLGNSLTLTDGEHTVVVRATDAAGNQSTTSKTIRVDTNAPLVSLSISAIAGHMNWYVSEAVISADPSDAISGVALTEYRLDEGSWEAGETTPAVTTDGAHTVDFRITDLAGNQTLATKYFWIDATSPTSAFVNPTDGSTNTLYGDVHFSGESSDATSGLNGVQLSLDNGTSWQSLSLVGNHWSYAWDTRPMRDGTYTILARTNDVAGNTKDAAPLTVVVANAPPKVKVQDWWWSWQTGAVTVKAALVPIQQTTITISCEPYHRDVVLHFGDTHSIPSEIQWDRHCGEGAYAADAGDYPVTVQACDTFGRCTSAVGAIKVPFFAPVSPTWTPTIAPTATATPQKTRLVQKPIPTRTALPPVVVSEDLPPTPIVVSAPFWPWFALALVGFLMAFAASSLADRRPQALKQLGKTISKVHDG